MSPTSSKQHLKGPFQKEQSKFSHHKRAVGKWLPGEGRPGGEEQLHVRFSAPLGTFPSGAQREKAGFLHNYKTTYLNWP